MKAAIYITLLKKHVYSVIEQLTKDGYRAWFDYGVEFGSKVTNEFAEKISFVVFFSSKLSNTADLHKLREGLIM